MQIPTGPGTSKTQIEMAEEQRESETHCFCPKCGTEATVKTSFCTMCGASLAKSIQPISAATPNAPVREGERIPSGPKLRRAVPVIAVALIVLVFGGILAIALS